jgi:hypothetical protein
MSIATQESHSSRTTFSAVVRLQWTRSRRSAAAGRRGDAAGEHALVAGWNSPTARFSAGRPRAADYGQPGTVTRRRTSPPPAPVRLTFAVLTYAPNASRSAWLATDINRPDSDEPGERRGPVVTGCLPVRMSLQGRSAQSRGGGSRCPSGRGTRILRLACQRCATDRYHRPVRGSATYRIS